MNRIRLADETMRNRPQVSGVNMPRETLGAPAALRRASKPRPVSPFAVVLCLLVTLMVGCSGEELPTGYGRVHEPAGMPIPYYEPSINGTRVLAGMFREAGHDVDTLDRLSQRLDDFDCVVWFVPNSPVPSPRMIDVFDRWLDDRPGRTVIFVGRGYDAEIDYWREVTPLIRGEDTADSSRRRAEARARLFAAKERFATSYLSRIGREPRRCPWFTLESRAFDESEISAEGEGGDREASRNTGPFGEEPDEPVLPWEEVVPAEDAEAEPHDVFEPVDYHEPYRVKTLSGRPEWTETIDAGAAEIVLYDRMTPANDMEVLLESDDGLLVGRLPRTQGQVVVVANGSFLLNMPLVNDEHRKLAGRLIHAIGAARQSVCFLQVGDFEADEERAERTMTPAGLALLMVWPVNVIFFQILMVGVLLTFYLLPLFGRPRRRNSSAVSDFGKHLDALGRLLAQSGEYDYVRSRYEQYWRRAEELKRRP